MGAFGGTASSQLRASDAERHEAADLLARHFADGRLDQGELDERMGQAMGAKTRKDLAALLADLPPLDEPHDRPAPAVAAPPRARRRHLAGAVAAVALVLVALSWLQHALFWHGWLWPGWVGRPRVPVLVVALVALALLRRARRRHRGPLAPGRPEGPAT